VFFTSLGFRRFKLGDNSKGSEKLAFLDYFKFQRI